MKSIVLKPLYDKVVRGLPVLGTPADVARRFGGGGDGAAPGDAAERMARLYVGLGGATGFLSGLPGFLLLPVTLPANLVGVAALQLHLAAAIAHLGGHDLHDPTVRDRIIGCLLDRTDGTGENSEEAEVATRTGVKLAERGVRLVAEKSIGAAKWAAKKVVLRRVGARRIPLLGGFIGAGSDGYVTHHVAQCARERFLPG